MKDGFKADAKFVMSLLKDYDFSNSFGIAELDVGASMTSLLLMITLCLLTPACAFFNEHSGRVYQYGKKIDYSDHEVKKLPDISIRFLEKRHESSPVFPRGFTYYDFEVMKGEQKKRISWSSGTGVIGPSNFEIGDEEYVLELAASKAYDGFMKEGEMVIWRKEEYEKLQKN